MMHAIGNVAAGAAGMRGLPIPTQPLAHPAVDLVDRIEAARARRATRGIQIVEQPPVVDDVEPSIAVPNHATPQPSTDDEPVELPDYILAFAVLMRDTEGHPDPDVAAARKATANAAMALHRIWTSWQKRQQRPATPKRQPKPRGPRKPPTGRGPRAIDPAVVDAMIRLYTGPEQATVAQIAARLDVSIPTVRRYLNARRVPKRDDRTTHSGGANRTDLHDPQLAADVIRRYVDQQQTTAEIARALRMSTSTVARILRANDVQLRPALSRQPADRAVGLKARMTEACVTARQVRGWARREGIDIPDVGLPSAGVLDAFLAARGQA